MARPRKMQYHSMYYFKYNPKFKDVLPYWDKFPFIIPLNIGATHTLGLNTHWIPQRFKKKFIEWLINQSMKLKTPSKFSRVTYDMIKKNPQLRPALQGIRLYINTRMSTVTEVRRKEIQNFFLPRQVAAGIFKKYKARKYFKDDDDTKEKIA